MVAIKNSDSHQLLSNEITLGGPLSENNKNSKINGLEVTNIKPQENSKSPISPEAKVMRVCAALVAASAFALFAGILLSSITTLGVAVILPLVLFGTAGIMAGGIVGTAAKITSMMDPDKAVDLDLQRKGVSFKKND